MEMKDRIRLIMEEQHMNQQVFAEFIGLSPATLCSIYNGRTRPTLNVLEAIKKKLPQINTDWLMMGLGDMYVATPTDGSTTEPQVAVGAQEAVLPFDGGQADRGTGGPQPTYGQSVRSTRLDLAIDDKKNIDKHQRKVTEIRVYYDDQTYETFVPAKGK